MQKYHEFYNMQQCCKQDMLKVLEILKKHDLRVTPSRVTVIELIIEKKSAITQKELNNHPEFKGHRVTLYRTLKQLEEANVLEKIANHEGEIFYALKHEEKHEEAHLHPHFNCKKCSRVICLNKVDLPVISLPNGFEKEHTSLLIYGVCDECS